KTNRHTGPFRTWKGTGQASSAMTLSTPSFPLRPSMIVFSVVTAVLVAHHFRWRSEGQHIGCHPDAGREFEGVKTSARKSQLDEVGDPSWRLLGRFGNVDAVSAFF